MKRFLSVSLITLSLVISVAGAAPVAHAQDIPIPADAGTVPDLSGTALDPTGSITAANNAAAQAAASTPTSLAPPATYDFNGVTVFIAQIFAWLLGVAAVTLDYAVYYTVVTMGNFVHNLTGVGIAWRVLRDIGNIVLIFGFLAIGITTILDVKWYGGGFKMLPMLLVAAVFLNFSIFLSEAVIDTGNLFATQFYTQINGGNPAGDKLSAGVLTGVNQEGISNKIMSSLGLQSIYGDVRGSRAAEIFKNSWSVGFMSIILFLVAAFVFFSLAFILIARFVILLFLIIIAPIGFAGLAIPQMKGTADKWWHTLFEQTITAPILLLLLYIAILVITDAQFLIGFTPPGSTPSYTGYIDGNLSGFAGVILSFLVGMGLLLAVVIISKKLSAFGAAGATKLAGRVTGALSFGAISLAGRGTLGAAGYALNSKRMQRRAAEGSLAARFASFAGRNLEKRTFDLRNVPGARTAGSALGGAIQNSGLETVLAGGSARTAKSAIDATREAYKTYKPFSGEWWRDQQREYEAAKTELDRKDVLASAVLPPNPASVATQKELKKMSVDELAQLKDIRGGIDRLVFNLSPEKFNELMKSDKLLPGEKNKLSDTWDTQFATPAAATTTMGRFSTEEIAALGGGTLVKPDVVDTLGVTEFEAIRRKGSLTKQQRHDMFTHMVASPAGSPLAAVFGDYFLAANDPGGNRERYWNV